MRLAVAAGAFCWVVGEEVLFPIGRSMEGRTEDVGVPLALGIDGEVMRAMGFAGDSLRGEVIVAMTLEKWRLDYMM